MHFRQKQSPGGDAAGSRDSSEEKVWVLVGTKLSKSTELGDKEKLFPHKGSWTVAWPKGGSTTSLLGEFPAPMG